MSGFVIIINKNIQHTPVTSVDSCIDNVAIKLMDDTVIRGVYNSPSNYITQQTLHELFTHPKMLLIGDLNARHVAWSNNRNNRNGNSVFDYTLDHNIAVLAPDSPSHFPSNKSTPSVIDIILNKNYPHLLEPKSLPLLTSDHNQFTSTYRGRTKMTLQL